MIDQTHALIAHFDVEHLIETGEVRWSLIHVDLEAGRQGVAAVQAAKAYHALPKFKIAAPTHGSTAQPTEPEGSCLPSGSVETREQLKARVARMEQNARDTGWHAEFVAQWSSFGISKDSTDDEIAAALDTIEPPFNPDPQPHIEGMKDAEPQVERIDRGDPVHPEDIEALVASIKSSSARALVNTWLVQSRDAGCSWDVRHSPYERHYQITAAALRLAEAAEASEDDIDPFARMVIALVIGDLSAIQETFVVGETLAVLTTDEARRIADICARLTQTDGPIRPADVAAALAAA